MIWEDINLYTEIEGNTDKLGNKIKQVSFAGSRKARYTPWTADEIQLIGRELTHTMRKYLVHSEPFEVPIVKIGLHGKTYEVTRVEEFPTRSLIMIEAKGFRDVTSLSH